VFLILAIAWLGIVACAIRGQAVSGLTRALLASSKYRDDEDWPLTRDDVVSVHVPAEHDVLRPMGIGSISKTVAEGYSHSELTEAPRQQHPVQTQL